MDCVWIELEQELSEAKKEIEETYTKCKNNKKFKCKNKARQSWYYKRLKERIKYKVYVKHRLTIFSVIEKHVDLILPKTIVNQLCQFVDIRNVGLGDKV